MAVNVYYTNCAQFNMSRNKMLIWLNEHLQEKYTTIEELGSGIAYCQLINSLFPGAIYWKRIRYDAKLEHEHLHNFKLLQQAFRRLKIEKNIPVHELIKNSYKENLRFLQWLIKFFEVNKNAMRENALLERSTINGQVILPSSSDDEFSRNKRIKSFLSYRQSRSKKKIIRQTKSEPEKCAKTPKYKPIANICAKSSNQTVMATNDIKNRTSMCILNKVERCLDELYEENATLSQIILNIRNETGLFMRKLRDIEILCNINQDEDTIKVDDLKKILFNDWPNVPTSILCNNKSTQLSSTTINKLRYEYYEQCTQCDNSKGDGIWMGNY